MGMGGGGGWKGVGGRRGGVRIITVDRYKQSDCRDSGQGWQNKSVRAGNHTTKILRATLSSPYSSLQASQSAYRKMVTRPGSSMESGSSQWTKRNTASWGDKPFSRGWAVGLTARSAARRSGRRYRATKGNRRLLGKGKGWAD